jgi:hypothetical protein
MTSRQILARSPVFNSSAFVSCGFVSFDAVGASPSIGSAALGYRAGFAWFVLLLSLVMVPLSARAEVALDRVELDRVELGVASTARIGHWTSLRVAVTLPSAPSAQLRVAAQDADGQWATTTGPVATANASGTLHLEAPLRLARTDGDLRLELVSGATRLAEWKLLYGAGASASLPAPVRHDTPVWVVAGGAAGFAGPKATAFGRQVVTISRGEQLPGLVEGYGGIDVLVLATAAESSPTGQAAAPPIWTQWTESQWLALRDWVATGGHLVLSVGESASEIAASPLGAWLPIPIVKPGSVRQLGRLESFAIATVPIPVTVPIPRALLGPFVGQALVDDNEGPLVARAAYGFGLVTLLAVDLNRGPFVAWKAVDDLGPLLIETASEQARRKATSEQPLRHQGLSDLGSQLAAALDQFPGIRRTSYWWVLGQLLVLLLVVGPFDYYLTNHWLKRPMLTWLTLPCWLSIGLLVATAVASAGNGATPRANQLTLIDIDAPSGRVRGTAWTTLYSAETARVDLAVRPASIGPSIESSAPVAPRISWIAEPEGSPGGLYRGAGLTGGQSTYELSPEGVAQGVPMAQWSSRQFLSEWNESGAGWVESSLESSGPGRLAGSVTSNLSAPLEDVILVFGGRVFFPRAKQGRLLPFQPWEPSGPQGQQRDLRAYLTGTTGQRVEISGTRSEVQFRAEPYQPLQFDLVRIGRMLSFHDISGGRPYTGLDNDYYRRLELSSLMQVGRAILVGRLPIPTSSVTVDGKPLPELTSGESLATTTLVRCVFPVKIYFEEERLLDKDLRIELDRKRAAGSKPQ